MSEFLLYKYYKGEPANPFTEGSGTYFWGYELMFHQLFNSGDFSLIRWARPTMTGATKGKLKVLLEAEPRDKEGLFKLWMYHILNEYLPDKFNDSGDAAYFNSIY